MFDLWMRLLNAVDGSVLWLKENDTLAAQNLRLEAERRGAKRVVALDHYAWSVDLPPDVTPDSVKAEAEEKEAAAEKKKAATEGAGEEKPKAKPKFDPTKHMSCTPPRKLTRVPGKALPVCK